MPFLDSKGKLFGKINIIDLAVIITVIVAGIVGFKLVFKLASIGTETQRITISMKIGNVNPSIANSIKVGDVQKDLKGEIIANITSIILMPRSNSPNKDMLLKANILTNIKDNELIFDDQQIRIGNNIYLRTEKNLLHGYILTIGEEKNITSEKENYIILRINSKNQEFVDLIQIGDKEIFNNKTIAEIVDKEIISPKDALRKNLLLKIKVLVQMENNKSYYKGQEILIGAGTSITTSRYTLNGEIQDIGDKSLRKNTIEKIIELKMYYEYPYVKDTINIGDKEIDANNRIIAEILNKEVKPAEYVGMDAGGNILVKPHPTQDEITLIIKLQTTKEGDNFLYNDQILKIGNWITIRTPNFNIGGRITKIQ